MVLEPGFHRITGATSKMKGARMNTLDLYEFCMDWQGNIVSKDVLWIEFVEKD